MTSQEVSQCMSCRLDSCIELREIMSSGLSLYVIYYKCMINEMFVLHDISCVLTVQQEH